MEQLRRIMKRVRTLKPDVKTVRKAVLQEAIRLECGKTERTFYNVKQALELLEWIRPHRKHYLLTNKDLDTTE